jgi:hypothetical protein
MPIGKYRGITLQKELVNVVEQYITTHPETGYKSLADFVTDAVREKCMALNILTPIPDLPPLEHFNLSEHGVRILDRNLANTSTKGRIIDVYFKPEGIWCEHCESTHCRHVTFALSLPAVQKILARKGWKTNE